MEKLWFFLFLLFFIFFPTVLASSEHYATTVTKFILPGAKYYYIAIVSHRQNLDKFQWHNITFTVYKQNIDVLEDRQLATDATVVMNITSPSNTLYTDIYASYIGNGEYTAQFYFNEIGTWTILAKIYNESIGYTIVRTYIYVGNFPIYVDIITSSEYSANENVSIIGYVFDKDRNPVETADCTLRIYKSSTLILQKNMTSLGEGIYEAEIITPSEFGTYTARMNCQFGNYSNYDYSTFTILRSLSQISPIHETVTKSFLMDVSVIEVTYPGKEFKASISFMSLNQMVDPDWVYVTIVSSENITLLNETNITRVDTGFYELITTLPNSTTPGIYNAIVTAQYNGKIYKKSVPFTVQSLGPADVKVTALVKQITPNNFVPFRIRLENKGLVGADFSVTYWIEYSGKIYDSGKETIYVAAKSYEEIDRALFVPFNAPIGTWFVKAELIYDPTQPPVQSYDTFFVVSYPVSQPYPQYFKVKFLVPFPMNLEIRDIEKKIVDRRVISPNETLELKAGFYFFKFTKENCKPIVVQKYIDKYTEIKVEPVCYKKPIPSFILDYWWLILGVVVIVLLMFIYSKFYV